MSLDLSDFVNFTLPGAKLGDEVSADELKRLAGRMQAAMNARGFDCGGPSDLFGSSSDIWIVPVTMEEANADVMFDVSQVTGTPNRWNTQIALEDVGMTKATRAERLAAMARIECALHQVLTADLKALGIEWQRRKTYCHVDEYFSFLLPDSGGGTESDVETFVDRLCQALSSRGLDICDRLGASRDYRGIVVHAPACQIFVGVTPDLTSGYGPLHAAASDRWSVQIYLDKGGWWRSTRAKRSEDFLTTETKVREALVDLGSREFALLLWMGRSPKRVPQQV